MTTSFRATKHLKGLEFVRDFCGGSMTGLEVGSVEVAYDPRGQFRERVARADGTIFGATHMVDVKTAGSCTLLLQTALPCLVASLLLCRCVVPTSPDSKRQRKGSEVQDPTQVLVLRGGTDVPFAPLADYAIRVLCPALLARFGVKVSAKVNRRGFYPKGKGELEVRVSLCERVEAAAATSTSEPRAAVLKRFKTIVVCGGGKPKDWKGESWKPLATIAEKMAEAALKEYTDDSTAFEKEVSCDEKSLSPGLSIVLAAETNYNCVLGASRVMEPRTKNWKGQAKPLVGEIAAALRARAEADEHLQDQLLVLMAIIAGEHSLRCSELTTHTLTSIELLNRMLAGLGVRFEAEEREEATTVKCSSRGLAPL